MRQNYNIHSHRMVETILKKFCILHKKIYDHRNRKNEWRKRIKPVHQEPEKDEKMNHEELAQVH